MEWTREKIEALSPQRRGALFDNAQASPTDEAKRIIDLMVEHDLLIRNRDGLPRKHPIIQTIERIVRSPEGIEAGKAASDDGLPAIAGVDRMLVEALGEKYGTYDTTSWAGTFMNDVMVEAGYIQTKKKHMPRGYVAKYAAFFEKA